ncbi:MAG: hypothetical protein JO316_18510 [Abitibacteriaceae bacterium]|nr:hypothetical protein [Abditibacteriaceae bacterium]
MKTERPLLGTPLPWMGTALPFLKTFLPLLGTEAPLLKTERLLLKTQASFPFTLLPGTGATGALGHFQGIGSSLDRPFPGRSKLILNDQGFALRLEVS